MIEKELEDVETKKRDFLRKASTSGATTATGAVGLASLKRASSRKIEELIPTVPTNLSETLVNGGQRTLPNYEVVPLKIESFMASAIQMSVQMPDMQNPKPRVKENVEHAIAMIHATQYLNGGKGKLLAFPQFCLSSSQYGRWNRKTYLDLAIELPGEETDQIGECAKMYDCYIEMAAPTRDPEWPNHFFNNSFIIAPNGKIIHQHWKAFAPGGFEYATCVHDVLDEFVKRYGWETVWPVAKTDIGNIATMICSESHEFGETARIFALNGTEILVYSISGTGGTNKSYIVQNILMQADCYRNNCYGIVATNSALHFREPGFDKSKPYMEGWEPSFAFIGGYSCIIGPKGRILDQLNTCTEGVVSEQIFIGVHRKGRSIPVLRNELYAPGYQRPSKYPKNIYINYQPQDVKDAVKFNQEKAQW